MSGSKLRLAVIGVGSWSNRIHIPQIVSHPDAEVVALCTRTEEKLRQTGEEFGVSARMQPAQQSILHDRDHLSFVVVPFVGPA